MCSCTYLSFLMVHKKYITRHALNVVKLQHRFVVFQLRIKVNVLQHFGDFGAHAMLQTQSSKWHTIHHHSLE